MFKKELTRTFAPLALAGLTSLLSSSDAQAQTTVTNYTTNVVTHSLPIQGYFGFATTVNTNITPAITNKVYNATWTNATPGASYTFIRRPFLEAGENLGHQWTPVAKRRASDDGIVSFTVGNYHPKQEFFAATYLATNIVETITTNTPSTNGVSNASN
jgi:hypothetical protein